MRVQGHVAGGVLAAAAVIAMVDPPTQVAHVLLLIGAVAGGCPDLDILLYFLRKRALVYEDDFRHHTWMTHTFVFYWIPSIALFAAGAHGGWLELQWAAAVFGLATTIHLLQDMYGTGDGIMALYPFSRRMYGLELTGTHGPTWLAEYLTSRACRVENATVLLAGFYLVSHIGGALLAGA